MMTITKIITDSDGNYIKNGNKYLCEIKNDEGKTEVDFFFNEDVEQILKMRSSVNNKDDNASTSDDSSSSTSVLAAYGKVKSNRREAWATNEIRYLLDQYCLYFPQVGPGKPIRNMKLMWEKISDNINAKFKTNRNATQCSSKYKYECDVQKKSDDHNRKSGNEPLYTEFQEEFKKIKDLDDSVKPEILVGIGQIDNLKFKDYDGSPPVKKSKDSKESILRELHAITEEGRERRHKEKCDLIKMLLKERKE